MMWSPIKNMSMRIAIGAIRLGRRPQESLQGSADRRQGDPGSGPTFAPRRCRGLLLLAELLQRQEPVRQHHQASVVMEPAPRPALEMVQTQFLLHLLIALFHWPAALPQSDRPDPAGPWRQVRE